MTRETTDAPGDTGRSKWSRYLAVGLGVLIAAAYVGGCMTFRLAHMEAGSPVTLLLPHMLLEIAGIFGPKAFVAIAFVACCLLRFRTGLSLLVLAPWLFACWSAYWRLNIDVCERSWPRIAERARPVTAAILAYEKRNGHAPEKLEQLIPEFLQAIPDTGVGCHPRFQMDDYGRHPGGGWALTVWMGEDHPPMAHLPMLIYWPTEKYPDAWPPGTSGSDGWFTPIGNGWAYFSPND